MNIKKLLKYLVCPYCQGRLILKNRVLLICLSCREDFKVVRGIPVLMKSEYLNTQEKSQQDWFENHYSHLQFSNEKYALEKWRESMLKRIFNLVYNQLAENSGLQPGDEGEQIKTSAEGSSVPVDAGVFKASLNFRKKTPAFQAGEVYKNRIKIYLDIGCGATGYTVIEAARRNKWLSFGVDISLEAMLKAKALAQKNKVADKTGFLVCSAEHLPFRNGIFDYISAISLLEHIKNDEEVIRAVSRITRGKGLFYICVPNTYWRMWPFFWPVYRYIDHMIGHKRHYSLSGLSAKLRRSGFPFLQDVQYNGHLAKLAQLILDKLGLINQKQWWVLEENDINSGPMGLQLNAIYKKA